MKWNWRRSQAVCLQNSDRRIPQPLAMVIVKLVGGLGNQLFQYAAGQRLARARQTPLKLDLSAFEHYKLHAYSLNHFNIQEQFASRAEAARFCGRRLADRIYRRVQMLLPYRSRSWLVERHYHFDPDILRAGADVYLDGFWQSEKYFADEADLIRREFTIKTPMEERDREVAGQIAGKNSVSLHVRRCDYVTAPGTARLHGGCDLEYYARALNIIKGRLSDPHVFVFSDDMRWVVGNLPIDLPVTFVDHNRADKNYEDLRLMSLCRHHVIANSTFSWWAAWLGAHAQGLVIAPQKWFQHSLNDTKDLIPLHWTCLG